MELVVDDRHPGTDESIWLGAGLRGCGGLLWKQAFTWQIRPCDPEARNGPLLTDLILRRFWRPFDECIEGGP